MWNLALVVSLLVSVAQCQTKKDVLFIAVDDLRTQLGAYGDSTAKTPSIDALASKSLVFDKAYCQVAVCSPSRASLLTGRRPDTNHVWRISPDQYWRSFTNATTIPQYFKENGYTSIGMGKIFHPGPPGGNDDSKYSWSVPYYHGTDDVRSPNSWHCFDNISDSVLRDGKIADNAIATLKEIKQNRTKGNNTPFFLAVGFHKPHLPFFAPTQYCDLYPAPDQIPLPLNRNAPTDMPPIAWTTYGELKMYSDMAKYRRPECQNDAETSMSGEACRISDSDTQLLRRGYYASLSFTDSLVGKVVSELENQGMSNNTLIAFWGDHGWKLGEHNSWGKFTNLEDDTHVPFMLRVPGMTDSGIRTSALVELIDMFPSLSELAGIPVPPVCPVGNKDLLTCVEGTSVAPLLKDPKQQWKKAAFSQYPRPNAGLMSIPGKPPFSRGDEGEDVMGYAVRVDTYRFVEWYGFDHTSATPNWDDIWGTELYNHTHPVVFFNDENTNLAGNKDMQQMVLELRKMLQAGWREAMPPGTQ
jgi:arylsulfatase A-like enzyme